LFRELVKKHPDPSVDLLVLLKYWLRIIVVARCQMARWATLLQITILLPCSITNDFSFHCLPFD